MIVYLFAILTISRIVIYDTFLQIENKLVANNTTRVINEIDNEKDNLTDTLNDWSAWDDTYVFIQDKNQEYLKNNVTEDSLSNIRVNAMLFFDLDKELVHTYAVNNEGNFVQIPQAILNKIQADTAAFNLIDPEDFTNGYIIDADYPLIYAARPIIDSLAIKPKKGTLIFFRFMDETFFESISQRTLLTLTTGLSTENLDEGFKSFQQWRYNNPGTSEVFINQEAEMAEGYFTISGIGTTPLLFIRTEIPKDITRQGQTLFNYSLAYGLTSTIIFVSILIYILQRSLYKPLTKFQSELKYISSKGDTSKRISTNWNQEFTELSHIINNMLDSLEKNTSQLNVEQSKTEKLNDTQEKIMQHLIEQEARMAELKKEIDKVKQQKA